MCWGSAAAAGARAAAAAGVGRAALLAGCDLDAVGVDAAQALLGFVLAGADRALPLVGQLELALARARAHVGEVGGGGAGAGKPPLDLDDAELVAAVLDRHVAVVALWRAAPGGAGFDGVGIGLRDARTGGSFVAGAGRALCIHSPQSRARMKR